MEIVLPLLHCIYKRKCQHFIYFPNWLFCLAEWSFSPPPHNPQSAFAWFHIDNESTHLHLSQPCYKPLCSRVCSFLAGAKAWLDCSLKKNVMVADMLFRQVLLGISLSSRANSLPWSEAPWVWKLPRFLLRVRQKLGIHWRVRKISLIMSGDVFREGSIDWEPGGKVIDSGFYLLVGWVFIWLLPLSVHVPMSSACWSSHFPTTEAAPLCLICIFNTW